MATLSMVVLAESERELEALTRRVGAANEGAAGLAALCHVVAGTAEAAALGHLVALHQPHALLVELGEKADLTLDAVNALADPRPMLLAAGPDEDSRLILRAMRAGAREYLPRDAEHEMLRASLASLAASLDHDGAISVGVMGAKGGIGATMVACQLAHSLRRLGGEVALVDLNLHHGDVDLYLDLRPQYTLADVARRQGDIDSAYLATLLERHSNGIALLAAPERPEDAERVLGHHIDAVSDVLCDDCDWILFDLSRRFDDATLRALDRLDQLLIVTAYEIPALHNTRRILELLERIGLRRNSVRLVVNRDDRGNTVSERDFADYVGRSPDFRLPNDFEAVQECVSFGKGLAEAAAKSPLRVSFEELALVLHDWAGRPRPESREDPKGLRRYLRKAIHGTD